MLAGGVILAVSQRQHLATPEVHTAEIVSASTNLHFVMAINGTLQELHIRQGHATPFYLDSLSSVHVSNSDTAVKKSVWLIRRAAVLAEGVKDGEIESIHINDPDMVADHLTKYLPYEVWRRHVLYMLNYD